MDILKEISFVFNSKYKVFNEQFFELFIKVMRFDGSKLFINSSNTAYYPKVSIDSIISDEDMFVWFITDHAVEKVIIKNETGITKDSYEIYGYIELDDLKQRFIKNSIDIKKIDHIGFNLPWFESSINPQINELRNKLATKCLYHKFPDGNPWDFILPGSKEEIGNKKAINYSLIRKPKIELVSFDKTSKPIIQFDVCCSCDKSKLKSIFPEGLYDQNLGNIWIYISNPYKLDICIVLGEDYEGDWSGYFRNNRILL